MKSDRGPKALEAATALWESRKLRFLLVGGWNTLFGYGFFAALYLALGSRIHYLVLGVFSHLVAVTQSFVTQRRLVFRSTKPWLPEYLRFHATYLGIFFFGLAALPALVELGHLDPLLAQGILLVVTVLASYLIHRGFTFRHHDSA